MKPFAMEEESLINPAIFAWLVLCYSMRDVAVA